MLIRVPDYYDKFRCLAGACPHSCCEKWEVVVDEDTARRYLSVPGALGEKLRAELRCDADGDWCFPLNGGRCPFLDEENLCQIHRELGQEATSVTCREHPRFTEDYGAFREITLSASCPAANDLLLGSTAPLGFVEWETDE
ncbi:MAG: flagellar protein FliB, partial [Ruminococcaceae bacterium]|nr:flagellar protein FliB [Oscillospiraceae bacterium]